MRRRRRQRRRLPERGPAPRLLVAKPVTTHSTPPTALLPPRRPLLLGPHPHSPELSGHAKPRGWGRGRSSPGRWGCLWAGSAQACPGA